MESFASGPSRKRPIGEQGGVLRPAQAAVGCETVIPLLPASWRSGPVERVEASIPRPRIPSLIEVGIRN